MTLFLHTIVIGAHTVLVVILLSTNYVANMFLLSKLITLSMYLHGFTIYLIIHIGFISRGDAMLTDKYSIT